MKYLQLLFSNEVVLEDERIMKLDYSLTEKISELDQMTPYYGVRVTKHLDNLLEAEEVLGISNSKDDVISIINKLYQFEVTPISMVEILDELITQCV
ncbi:MAG: DUF6514 family protein [Mobilitalea sp.]